ncbi:MAG: hypothetical protein R3C56_15665 [Pirellulaceae bacterium]
MAKRRQARPAEILQAAIEEFSENGFAGAKIEAIAARRRRQGYGLSLLRY